MKHLRSLGAVAAAILAHNETRPKRCLSEWDERQQRARGCSPGPMHRLGGKHRLGLAHKYEVPFCWRPARIAGLCGVCTRNERTQRVGFVCLDNPAPTYLTHN